MDHFTIARNSDLKWHISFEKKSGRQYSKLANTVNPPINALSLLNTSLQ